MKKLATLALAAGLGLGLAFFGHPALAQAPGPAQPQLKPATPVAVAAAREILTMKNVSAMYAGAVPGIVQRTKDSLIQSNLNYQRDLNDVAVTVAQTLAGREKEIGEQMAKIYASEFTEQELQGLVAFYKSPLGQKLLAVEPKAIAGSMSYMNQWALMFSDEVNAQFKAEMHKRGKDI